MLEKINKQKLLSILNNISIVALIACLFIVGADDLIAANKKAKPKPKPRKKARVYNPAQTKAKAITRLQTSNELSELARIEPNALANGESQAYQKAEIVPVDAGQMLSDVDILKTFLSDEELVDMENENGDEG